MSHLARRLPLVVLLLTLSATAQTTPTAQPAESPAALELRATNTFNSGRYAEALPMLRKLEATYSPSGSHPDALKLQVVQEQIRVSQRNLQPRNLQPAPYDPKANTPTNAAPFSPTPAGITPPGVALPADYNPANDPNLIQVETSAELRTKHSAPNDQIRDFSNIRLLGNFDYDAERGGNIPPDVTALTGSKIRIHGYMIPLDQAADITNFALVPSLFACCFGQPPSIQHTVMVQTPPGKAVAYYPDEIVVEGTLTVREKKDEGYIISVFELSASSVKPATK